MVTVQHSSRLLAAALEYADRGWPVFPCKLDKKPYTSHGFKEATTDSEQIETWWAQWPEASIGIPTGAQTFLVLDVDPRHGGHVSLAQLEQRHGELPLTRLVQTGGGGRQYYFQWPGVLIRNSAGELGAGLDVRGDGGYVIAPPSGHPSGEIGRAHV